MSKQATNGRESWMMQEYLFLSNDTIEEIKQYHVAGAKETYTPIKGTNSWIVAFSLKGDTMDNAKLLSSANDYIVAKYKPTVLTNGCAAHFTKKLYPLAVDFERGLRKLLYLKAAVSKSKAAEKNIKNLEEKNLEDIKYILFYDKTYYEGVNAAISQNRRFKKEEIRLLIDSIEEKTVWQAIFPNNPPEHLKEDFSTLMLHRNDIMHSHNINHEKYVSIKKSFELVNEEISTAIDNMVAQELDLDNAIEFDQSLGEAIRAQDDEIVEGHYTAVLNSYLNSSAVQNAIKILADIDTGALASNVAVISERAKLMKEWINLPKGESAIEQLSKLLSQLSKGQREESHGEDDVQKTKADSEDDISAADDEKNEEHE